MGTLLNRRRYMGGGGGSSPLPSGYTQLEYIYSNGDAFLSTLYQPTGDEQITIDTMITSFPAANNKYLQLFGCRNRGVVTDKNNYWLGVSNSGQVFCRFGTANPSQPVLLSETGVRRLFYVDLVNKSISINGTEMLTFSNSIIEGLNANVWIWRINSVTYGSELDHQGMGLRVYEFIIKKNGTNVCHLVPAKRNSDNVLGMYDLVAKAFRINAGSGSFSDV